MEECVLTSDMIEAVLVQKQCFFEYIIANWDLHPMKIWSGRILLGAHTKYWRAMKILKTFLQSIYRSKISSSVRQLCRIGRAHLRHVCAYPPFRKACWCPGKIVLRTVIEEAGLWSAFIDFLSEYQGSGFGWLDGKGKAFLPGTSSNHILLLTNVWFSLPSWIPMFGTDTILMMVANWYFSFSCSSIVLNTGYLKTLWSA